MGIEQPTFNPYDKKYKKVADLPKKEKDKYVDLNDSEKLPWVKPEEGFITKEAAEEDFDNYDDAKRHNYFKRSIVDKVLSKNKLSKTDIAHGKANELNKKLDTEEK